MPTHAIAQDDQIVIRNRDEEIFVTFADQTDVRFGDDVHASSWTSQALSGTAHFDPGELEPSGQRRPQLLDAQRHLVEAAALPQLAFEPAREPLQQREFLFASQFVYERDTWA
jgi:hypothetical protein